MTLIELLVAAFAGLIVLTAGLTFLNAVTHSSANDQSRNISLVEEVADLARMTRDLSQAYAINAPTLEEKTNVADVDEWLGSPQQNRRVVYNCAAASAIANVQECIRYEMPATDKTLVAELGKDASAKSSIAIPRLVNGTTSALVFSFKKDAREKETGKSRPNYVELEIKTPGAGELAGYANKSSDYTYSRTLRDSVYLRNLDLAE